MDELRKRAFTMQCEYDFQIHQFDVKQEAYKEAIEKLKKAKWYNKWYYERKEHKAYLDFIMTAGRMYMAKCLLICIIDEIKEKENEQKLQN